MKLIDLLVQELPKRGGWPEGADFVVQDHSGGRSIKFGANPVEVKLNSDIWQGWWHYTYSKDFNCDELSHDWETAIVNRDQYQSALAASQKVEWDGGGLPPAGCECEYLDSNGEWYPVTIKYKSDQLVVISGITKILDAAQETEIAKDIIIDKPKFRPIRSEADKKRDVAAKEMARHANDDENRMFDAGLRNCLSIYNAIAAGKIPSVKLED
ncbi:hypothetical protein BAHKABFF_00062 [Salmonella phage CF-SP1]|nr:hypothetical protein BAHKABFF_00062 [Salmonella phage CF-SP1]